MRGRSAIDSVNATRRQRLIWSAQIFVVLGLIWLSLNGLADWWLGVFAAALGAALGGFLATGRPYPWRPHRLVVFGLFFLAESFKGGLDVAFRALRPKPGLDPCFVTHPIGLPPGQPRTLMVSVVSLLPGTLSADLEEDGNNLLVHGLTPDAVKSVAKLEARVAWLFSIESSPE